METEHSRFAAFLSDARRVAPILGAVLVAAAAVVFGVHAHRAAQADAAQKKALTQQNQQLTSQLNATQSQLAVLSAKVNSLASTDQASPAAPGASAATGTGHGPAAAHRGNSLDPRFKKLQSQLDAQGKLIDAERTDIDSTRGDLASARSELTGSIARTHDELVVLEKKGELNFYEFDIVRAKEFKREGPLSISLKKADAKHGFADLALIVDDRNLTQKHVNLYQPAMFYEPDTMRPVEIVINDISKNHIHGYVSAPRYRKSELASMSNSGDGSAPGGEQAANSAAGDNDMLGAPAPDPAASSNAQPAPRKKLTLDSSASSNTPDE